MKRSVMLTGLAALALAFAPACSDDDGDGNGGTDAGNGGTDAGTDAGGGDGFQQPADTAAVNFSIDASARPGLYSDGDLEWKGNFSYDEETRILTITSDWCGDDATGTWPCVPLYDDGPWNEGGHEPAGATAGDDVFGITVFVESPTEDLAVTYGAQNAPTEAGTLDGGWIWVGDNGQFTLPAGSTDTINAEGLSLEAAGTYDLKLTLDTASLGGDWTYAMGDTVEVKGVFSSWNEQTAYDDGTHGDDTADDGIFTFVLSESDNILLLQESGTTVPFVWVLGAEEYKTGGSAEPAGTAAYTQGPSDTDWVEQPVTTADDGFGGLNTAVVIP